MVVLGKTVVARQHNDGCICSPVSRCPYNRCSDLRIRLSAFFLRRAPKPLVAPSSGHLKPLESGVTDNHGHAAWASEAQIMARFHGPGNLIGKTKEGSLFFDNPEQGPG